MESALLYNYRQKGHNAFKLRLRPYKNRFAKKKKKNGKRKEKKNKKQETKHYHQKGGRGEGKSIQRGGSLF